MAKRKKTSSATKTPPKSRDQRATEKRTLAMWALLGAGGEAFGGELKPEIDKAAREALKSEGLIEVTKRERGAFWLMATDKGWDWAEQHLSDALPDKTFGGAFVLRAWLTRLQAFTRARNFRLAEVLEPQAEQSKSEAVVAIPLDYADLRERIRAAYLAVAGAFNRRALIKDVRMHLQHIDQLTLDSALKRMQREDDVSLMQLDNRIDITDADRESAIQIGKEPRHILWISK